MFAKNNEYHSVTVSLELTFEQRMMIQSIMFKPANCVASETEECKKRNYDEYADMELWVRTTTIWKLKKKQAD